MNLGGSGRLPFSMIKNQKMKKILFVACFLFSAAGLRAQMVAVNTDVLMDVLQMPAIGAEVVVGERSTLSMNAFGGYHPWGKKMKALGLQPEYRYYFSGRPMSRYFVGIGALVSSHDITWKRKVYDGNAFGGGLTFGYVLSINKRLNVDFHAGFGAIVYRQKEYYEGDFYDEDYSINGVIRTNATGYTLLPTRLGISLSYILK